MLIGIIGKIIKGRYCVVEALKKGGEGHLYLAKDMELGVIWAVKELPIEKKREAKLLRILSHPLMPKMIDYEEREEYCYLVMEYIEGKNLKQLIDEGREFGIQEIITYASEILDILDYLHHEHPPIYYGDLKPDNIMLSKQGKIYLVDFGSAVFGYTDRQKLVSGTKGFAAPEQYEGYISEKSDLYAWGKTFYFC